MNDFVGVVEKILLVYFPFGSKFKTFYKPATSLLAMSPNVKLAKINPRFY